MRPGRIGWPVPRKRNLLSNSRNAMLPHQKDPEILHTPLYKPCPFELHNSTAWKKHWSLADGGSQGRSKALGPLLQPRYSVRPRQPVCSRVSAEVELRGSAFSTRFTRHHVQARRRGTGLTRILNTAPQLEAIQGRTVGKAKPKRKRKMEGWEKNTMDYIE